MSYKNSIRLLSCILFAFLFCITCTLNLSIAADDIVTSGGMGSSDKESDAVRGADFYQSDTQTSATGAVITQWTFAPDVGYGETGSGYSYTNPLTGATMSYSTTGMGMGAVPLPVYGGMNSQYGAASYGPYAFGNKPIVQSTPGYDTMSSASGSAFGQGYQYSQSAPNVTAMAGWQLASNPSTAALGYSMLASAGGFGTGVSPYSAGYAASPYAGISPYAATSAYRPTTSFGLGTVSPYGASFASPYTQTTAYNPYAASSLGYGTSSLYSSPYSTGGYGISPYTSSYAPTQYGYNTAPYYSGYSTSAYRPY